MRRLPRQPAPTLAHVAFTLLIALGLVLADLTIVRMQTAGGLAATRGLLPDSPTLLAQRVDDRFASRADCQSEDAGSWSCPRPHLSLDQCANGEYHPAATLSLTASPRATLARFRNGDPDKLRDGNLYVRAELLSALPVTSTLTADCSDLDDRPWRPARRAGAARSIPRPPPVEVP